jgi:hypothetical protein
MKSEEENVKNENVGESEWHRLGIAGVAQTRA